MPSIMPVDLIGTWTLETFEIDSPESGSQPWGRNMRGLLIYADTGHMSVSINKAVEADSEQTECENTLDSILFYSGTYDLDGEGIRHQVTNASNPNRIGKEQIRFASIAGDLLTLTTPRESFGVAIVKWRRIKP